MLYCLPITSWTSSPQAIHPFISLGHNYTLLSFTRVVEEPALILILFSNCVQHCRSLLIMSDSLDLNHPICFSIRSSRQSIYKSNQLIISLCCLVSSMKWMREWIYLGQCWTRCLHFFLHMHFLHCSLLFSTATGIPWYMTASSALCDNSCLVEVVHWSIPMADQSGDCCHPTIRCDHMLN